MMERRQFLGAAAALFGLPRPRSTADARGGGPKAIIEDRTVTDDGTYSITKCGSVPGGLNDVHIAADLNDGPIAVEGVHEEGGWSGIDLQWTSGPLYVGTGLDPDAARELAARLVVAADAAEGKFDD